MKPAPTLRTGEVAATGELAPAAIQGESIVERGVVIGGLMVCGSFLLAALLNRSAMEEVPAPPTPAAVVAPIAPPAVEAAAIDPNPQDCPEPKSSADSAAVTEANNAAELKRCVK